MATDGRLVNMASHLMKELQEFYVRVDSQSESHQVLSLMEKKRIDKQAGTDGYSSEATVNSIRLEKGMIKNSKFWLLC